MNTHQCSLLVRCCLLVLVILSIGFFLNMTIVNQMLQDRFNEQATRHIGILANGSIDDLLAKDYSDMEGWVRATAAEDAYAYAYIQSPSGKILVHSDLGYAGVQKKPIKNPGLQYHKIQFEDLPATEIIYPILLEGTLLGSAHLAYYDEHRDSIIKRYMKQLAMLYVALLASLMAGLYLLLKFSPSSPSTSD